MTHAVRIVLQCERCFKGFVFLFYDSCVFGKSVHKCLGKCGGIAVAAALSHRRRKSFRSHGGGGGRREAWSIKKTEITDTLYLTLNLLLTVSPMGLNVRKQNVRTFPSFKEYARGIKEKYEEGPKQCLPPLHKTIRIALPYIRAPPPPQWCFSSQTDPSSPPAPPSHDTSLLLPISLKKTTDPYLSLLYPGHQRSSFHDPRRRRE